MRLRSTVWLVLVCACVAVLGAWTDKPSVKVDAPAAATAGKPWNPLVEISRRGRRLDGLRPTMTIEGLDGRQTFSGRGVAAGTYRVRVIFPRPGYFTYTVKVGDRVESHGTVYAAPKPQ